MDQLGNSRVAEITDISAIYFLHKKKFASVVIIVMLISIVVAFSLSPVYRSTVNIIIEGQELPLAMVKTTVSGFYEDRLDAVEQRVTSSENLLAIVNKYDLYRDIRHSEEKVNFLNKMRKNIHREMYSVESVDPKNGRTILATVSFYLSFDSNDPQTAQNVARDLSELFLLENTKSRTEQAAKVSDFLADEAEKLNKQIVEIEYKLADFKQKNIASLPEHADINRRLLERAEGELVRIDYRINSLDERKREIESQIEVRAFERGAHSGTGEKILTIDQMLKHQRAKLTEARTRYSDIHPDVINLKSEIETLEAQKDNPIQLSSDESSQSDVPLNLIDITRKAQLDEITAEIIVEKNTREKLLLKFEGYEQRLFQTPIVERDYQILARDRENGLNTYRDLKDRQLKAEMAEQLEKENKAERLTIIEPASFPTGLQSPNRPGIIFLGFLLAMGMGVAVVTIANHFDNTIHGIRGVSAITNIPPIATIPMMGAVASDTKQKSWFTVSLLIGTIVIVGAYQVYLGSISNTLTQ